MGDELDTFLRFQSHFSQRIGSQVHLGDVDLNPRQASPNRRTVVQRANHETVHPRTIVLRGQPLEPAGLRIDHRARRGVGTQRVGHGLTLIRIDRVHGKRDLGLFWRTHGHHRSEHRWSVSSRQDIGRSRRGHFHGVQRHRSSIRESTERNVIGLGSKRDLVDQDTPRIEQPDLLPFTRQREIHMELPRSGFVLTRLVVRPDAQETTGRDGITGGNPEHGRDRVRQPIGQIEAAEIHRVGASIVELDPIVVIPVRRVLHGAGVLSHELVDDDPEIRERGIVGGARCGIEQTLRAACDTIGHQTQGSIGRQRTPVEVIQHGGPGGSAFIANQSHHPIGRAQSERSVDRT